MTELTAPCGSQYLHQHKVVSKWRKTEDGHGVEHTSCLRGFSQMGVDSKSIPGRRDSMEIHFMCEDCVEDHVLRLTQHKGTTQMEWIR